MNPKAILKFPKRSIKKGSAKSGVRKEKDSKYPTTLERLTYCFLVKKGDPADKVERDIADRVLWIEGELGDLGYPSRDAKLMAQALDFGHENYRGRHTRGLVLSCEEVSPENEHLRAGVFQSIRDSLVALAERLGVTRWLAIAHDDKNHPHVHFIFRNWDEVKRRRLDIRPKDLVDLQSMDWTDELTSGRGSTVGREKGAGSVREGEIQKYKTGAMPQQQELAARKSVPIRALQKFLSDRGAPGFDTPQGLAQFLFDHPSLPSDWDRTKLLTKKMGPRSNPAIIIAGVGLKLIRYYETLRKEEKKKSNLEEEQENLGITADLTVEPITLADQPSLAEQSGKDIQATRAALRDLPLDEICKKLGFTIDDEGDLSMEVDNGWGLVSYRIRYQEKKCVVELYSKGAQKWLFVKFISNGIDLIRALPPKPSVGEAYKKVASLFPEQIGGIVFEDLAKPLRKGDIGESLPRTKESER